MQVSAEIRWFWSDEPKALKDWFADPKRHPCAPGGADHPIPGLTPRDDDYLDDPDQVELGIKCRGKKPGIEIKGLVAVRPDLSPPGTFTAPVELWGKWNSPHVELDSSKTVRVSKFRQLRKFDTESERPVEIPLGPDELPLAKSPLPALGCQVEFTRIHLANGGVAWTFGLEAFGPLETLKRTLQSTSAVLEHRAPPSLASGELASYPHWLRGLKR